MEPWIYPRVNDELITLQATIASCSTLIHRFRLTLQSPTIPHPEIQDPPNSLAVLSDAFQILSAETTKLGLLVLNKPFTPSAITRILNSLCNGCLPTMMSALELCPASEYTLVLHNHVKCSLSITYKELQNFLASIPQDEHGIEKVRRDSLASTGVLWAECAKMIELGNTGLVGFARQQVEEQHRLLKDALQEIEEWDPKEEVKGFDTGSSPASSVTVEGDEDEYTLNKRFGDLSTVAWTPDLNDTKKYILLLLRKIRILYPALIKNRISTFPNITRASTISTMPTEEMIDKFDRLIQHPKQWTDCVDEIAANLYDHDEKLVEMRLNGLSNSVEHCLEEYQTGWDGEKDAFTGWCEKWMASFRKEMFRDGDKKTKAELREVTKGPS